MALEELTEEQVKQRRQRIKAVDPVEENNIETSEDRKQEFISGTVDVEYESLGRFSTPAKLSFKDYSTMDINAIVMSTPDKLVKTLVPILNGMICGEHAGKFDVSNMTVEEFIETLVAVKGKFNTRYHKHPYMCECQYDKPQDEQKFQDIMVDLGSLKYKSIEQVDEEIRATYKKDIEALTEEEWNEYKKSYAAIHNIDENIVTKEMTLENIKVTEPFVINPDGHEIALRLIRISDVIKAQELLDKEYSVQIKRIQNRQEHGVSGEDLKIKKQNEIEELEKEKAKKLLLYIKAFSLISIDGKQLTDAEKIKAMLDRDIFPNRVSQDINSLLDELKFGVFDTIEFNCSFCGQENKEDLQHNISVTELLPLNSKNERDSRHLTRLNVRFGA